MDLNTVISVVAIVILVVAVIALITAAYRYSLRRDVRNMVRDLDLFASDVNARLDSVRPYIIDYFAKRTVSDSKSLNEFVKKLLSEETLWGTDLTKINGFAEQIIKYLDMMEKEKYEFILQEIFEIK